MKAPLFSLSLPFSSLSLSFYYFLFLLLLYLSTLPLSCVCDKHSLFFLAFLLSINHLFYYLLFCTVCTYFSLSICCLIFLLSLRSLLSCLLISHWFLPLASYRSISQEPIKSKPKPRIHIFDLSHIKRDIKQKHIFTKYVSWKSNGVISKYCKISAVFSRK